MGYVIHDKMDLKQLIDAEINIHFPNRSLCNDNRDNEGLGKFEFWSAGGAGILQGNIIKANDKITVRYGQYGNKTILVEKDGQWLNHNINHCGKKEPLY